MDSRTGELLWRRRSRWQYGTAVLTTGGGLVFVGDIDRYMYAFDARDGTESVAHAHAHGDRRLPDHVRGRRPPVSRRAVRPRLEHLVAERAHRVARDHAAAAGGRLRPPGLRAAPGLTGSRSASWSARLSSSARAAAPGSRVAAVLYDRRRSSVPGADLMPNGCERGVPLRFRTQPVHRFVWKGDPPAQPRRERRVRVTSAPMSAGVMRAAPLDWLSRHIARSASTGRPLLAVSRVSSRT